MHNPSLTKTDLEQLTVLDVNPLTKTPRSADSRTCYPAMLSSGLPSTPRRCDDASTNSYATCSSAHSKPRRPSHYSDLSSCARFCSAPSNWPRAVPGSVVAELRGVVLSSRIRTFARMRSRGPLVGYFLRRARDNRRFREIADCRMSIYWRCEF